MIPVKTLKTFGSLIFSGVIKRKNWEEMVLNHKLGLRHPIHPITEIHFALLPKAKK